MTQVTNEMVEAAWAAWCNQWHQKNDWRPIMRAALEAAMTARRTATVDLATRLRWRNSYGSVQVDEALVLQAADLIERQAEEIARITAERDDLKHDIERHLQHLSGYETERAELIEVGKALNNCFGSYPNGYMGTKYYLHAHSIVRNVNGVIGKFRALLERLGAKEA